jgi:hypothetical protein
MSYWVAGALMAVGFLIGRAWDRPRKFADVDELVAQQRDRARAGVRDV